MDGWLDVCMYMYMFIFCTDRHVTQYCIPVGEYICMCIFLYTYR